MRPEKRINNFLKLLGKQWKEQGVDLRFGQFLFNNGIVDTNHQIYWTEESELLREFFPNIAPREYMYWGSYGIDGKGPIKYILIKNLETSHIENILKTHSKKITNIMKKILEKELKYRATKNKK